MHHVKRRCAGYLLFISMLITTPPLLAAVAATGDDESGRSGHKSLSKTDHNNSQRRNDATRQMQPDNAFTAFPLADGGSVLGDTTLGGSVLGKGKHLPK